MEPFTVFLLVSRQGYTITFIIVLLGMGLNLEGLILELAERILFVWRGLVFFEREAILGDSLVDFAGRIDVYPDRGFVGRHEIKSIQLYY